MARAWSRNPQGDDCHETQAARDRPTIVISDTNLAVPSALFSRRLAPIQILQARNAGLAGLGPGRRIQQFRLRQRSSGLGQCQDTQLQFTTGSRRAQPASQCGSRRMPLPNSAASQLAYALAVSMSEGGSFAKAIAADIAKTVRSVRTKRAFAGRIGAARQVVAHARKAHHGID